MPSVEEGKADTVSLTDAYEPNSITFKGNGDQQAVPHSSNNKSKSEGRRTKPKFLKYGKSVLVNQVNTLFRQQTYDDFRIQTHRFSAFQRASEEVQGAQRWISMAEDEGDEGEFAEYLLAVDSETNGFVSSHITPINFISIMGPTRSGKSTLMNMLAGSRTVELFASSPGGISFTKGVDLGNRIMSVQEFSSVDGAPVVDPALSGQTVGFLDTEGQGDQGDEYDIRLFTAPILCSKVVIFNTRDVARDTILNQLALLTSMAQTIIIDDGSEEETSGPQFGHLVLIINQYTLGGSAADLERNILGMESGNGSAVINRNRIRENLRRQFEDIALHVLRGNALRPGVAEDLESGKKEFLLLEDFIDSYQQDFANLRAAFVQQVQRPRYVSGNALTGPSTAGLVPTIVNTINLEEPLDIPNLWEQTQNAAINAETLQFRRDLRELCDAALHSAELLSTVQMSRHMDIGIAELLNGVERRLSYLRPAKLEETRQRLMNEADVEKEIVLEANLLRIQGFAQIQLRQLIDSIPQKIELEIPDPLVSRVTADSRLNALQNSLLEDYQNTITGYDPRGFPGQYEQNFETAFNSQRSIAIDKISRQWDQWVLYHNNHSLAEFRAQLEALSRNTPIGNIAEWQRGSRDIRQKELQAHNQLLVTTYLWDNSAEVTIKFSENVDEILEIAEKNFLEDEESVRQLVDRVLNTQVLHYENRLRNALEPQKEPESFATITDPSEFRNILAATMSSANVGQALWDDYMLEFDTRVAKAREEFRANYQTAFDDFIRHLDAELVILIQARNRAYRLEADRIGIHRNLERSTLRSRLTSLTNSELAQFDIDVLRFGITQSSGQLRIDTARADVEEQINAHTDSKFNLLDAAITEWNRERVNEHTQAVIVGVVDYTINTISMLHTRISLSRGNFLSSASGDDSDKANAWSTFEKKVPGLEDSLRRAAAVFSRGVNGTNGIPTELERRTLERIYGNVANLANNLGMSWINGASPFRLEQSSDENGTSRSYLYRNLGDPAADFWPDRPTSLRFRNWRVEFSDFVFDDPVVQELQPVTINQFNPPAQDQAFIQNVTLNRSETESVTNTSAVMFQFDLEYSSTAGIQGVASSTVRTAFSTSSTFTDARTNDISFSISFNTPIHIPPNRNVTITHLGFKQLLAMTYTAKVKIVPEVTFTGGFTRWGHGPYWSSTGNVNFHKEHTGTRYQGDIENGYVDELRAKAANNADPWAWQEAIRRHPSVQSRVNNLAQDEHYSFYVRGKWEGINGWKDSIKVDISVPNSNN